MDNLIIDGNFFQVVMWFFIYCFIGWVWESTYRSIRTRRPINSGFLVGPYIPIYGFGALLYILLMHFTTRPIELFFIGSLLACTLEYLTSFALEKIFHARWWDYTDRIGNINGRICLSGFFAFGAFAVVSPYIQIFVGNFVGGIVEPWLQIITIVIALIVLSDLATTARGLAKFNKVLRRYQKEVDRHTANFLDFVRRGKRSFEMRFTRGRHHARPVLTYIQRRVLWTFPNFDSVEYPDAVKHMRKLYASINKKFKATQYKPTKTKKK